MKKPKKTMKSSTLTYVLIVTNLILTLLYMAQGVMKIASDKPIGVMDVIVSIIWGIILLVNMNTYKNQIESELLDKVADGLKEINESIGGTEE